METGSQAAYARHQNVSKTTVTDWKSMGLVVFTGDGEVDFGATDAALQAHGIRQPGLRMVDAETAVEDQSLETDAKWTKAEAERVKENYAARLKQLEYDRESGLVVEIDDVVVAIASEYAVVRNKMLNIGSKVAPRVAVLKSAEEIKAIIDEAIIEALQELTIDADGERDFGKLRESIQGRFRPDADETAEGQV